VVVTKLRVSGRIRDVKGSGPFTDLQSVRR
jgi:hypothetical protein